MSRLGVNIDHIATLRQARQIDYPDPFEAVAILQKLNVDQITCHLREDRRHIQDHDLIRLIESQTLPINMEMALTDEMVAIACQHRPHTVTFVPEKREEVTTEGGLDVKASFAGLQKAIPQLKDAGIRISLFIDPDKEAVELSKELNVDAVELHTGTYCEVYGGANESVEWKRLQTATNDVVDSGLKVFAGHGLNWINLKKVAEIKAIEEYNIGHSIIARAVFLGLEEAVKEIQQILS